jgi:hypothetical protein
MRNVLIACCLALSTICCVPAVAQCSGGTCVTPGRVVVRTVYSVRAVTTARLFRRGRIVRR